MRLIFWELRKLARPSMLGVALAFIVIYLLAFAVSYAFQPFSEEHDSYERFVIQSGLMEQFGTELRQDALDELTRQRDAYFRTMDKYFKWDANMQKRGVKTDEQMRDYEKDHDEEPGIYDEYNAMMEAISTDEYEKQTLYTAQAYEYLVDELLRGYRLDAQWNIDHADSLAQAERYRELSARGWDSNLAMCVYEKLAYLVNALSRALMLASMLLSALLPTLDTLRRVRPMQYAARNGRGTFRRQMLTTVLASALVAGLAFWAFVLAYVQSTGSWAFMECDISGPFTWANPFWYDMTLWQYTAAKFGLIVVLCLSASLLGHLLGQFTGNFIQMLGALIPLGLGLDLVRRYVMENLFNLHNTQPLMQPLVAMTLLFICLGLLVFGLRWDKSRSIVA